MVYLLYGDDDFSIKEALDDIKASLGDRETINLNTTALDGKTVSLGELRAVCDTMPFMASTRLVLVHDLLSRFDPRPRDPRAGSGKSTANEAWTTLPSYLAGIPDTTTLVLIDGALVPRNAMLPQLRLVATIKQFPALRSAELEKWVRNRVSVLDGKITTGAVRLLCQLVGNNLWALRSEAEKLVLYCQGGEIQEKDVQTVTTQAREISIFTMVDAVAEGSVAQAVNALEELFDSGAAPLYVLFMVTRQYRLIIQMLEARQEKADLNTVGKTLGINNDFVFRKTREQAGRYNMAQLQEVYRLLLEADASIKRGQLPPEVALEALVPELCGIVRSPQRR
ncbi:MAG: DNA polymerase III subunit delta [Dehalococcoidia bacterium]|nr:DNA polymerase III subunit delta [Dehalococcoidia bacterium]